MPVVKMLKQVASRTLGSPACGCQPPTLPRRFLGTSPRQIPADANFHSTSFSEANQPRVLITGWVCFFFPHLWFYYFLLYVAVDLFSGCLMCQHINQGRNNQKLLFPLLASSGTSPSPQSLFCHYCQGLVFTPKSCIV